MLTDIFVKRPVLATVVSLFILVLGLRALQLLSVRQYPYTENAVVTVSTVYTGADPGVVAGFITTPLENSIAQANGIDYMTSASSANVSTITINLLLNYDPQKALADISTKVNAVLNQLPKESQQPIITIQIGQTLDAMYIGFYSDVLETNQITDYLVRVVQPKLQAVNGVQQAELKGDRDFAMRIWLDPIKLAGFNITPSEISTALLNNDSISAIGRTDGAMFTADLAASTNLINENQFRNMVIKAQNGAIVHLKDVAQVNLGSTNYDTSVSFNGGKSVYIGILVAPAANLLTVIEDIKKLLPDINKQLPQGLHSEIVYDSTKFVNSSIREVEHSLFEALAIVAGVIFLFLGSFRSIIIPLIAIPLSIIGTFFFMLILGFSVNLLTLLALVLGIGLVVDDAIIVLENVQRHMEEGLARYDAAILGASELGGPILAMTLVLVAVYVPIGFMGGLTGALFTEFAFTLAGAVTISAIIALTLSPMMCSRFLKLNKEGENKFAQWIDQHFDRLRGAYERTLNSTLQFLPVMGVFSCIILGSIYYLYSSSNSELAPMEDQGLVIAQLTGAPNATLEQMQIYSNYAYKVARSFPEVENIFQLDGISGLNSSIVGMPLKPWDERARTSNQLQPIIQAQLSKITGANVAAFQLPPLPGARGLPIQFVIQTTDSYDALNEANQNFLAKVRDSKMFVYTDTDLKVDKAQIKVNLDRDKIALFGLTMQDISNNLGAAIGQGYINYFDYSGRSYQVIPQIQRNNRQNASQLDNYYIKNAAGTILPISTFMTLQTIVVPETINHFQQQNSATLSAVAFPGMTVGSALDTLKEIAEETLPQGYTIEYAGPSRQYVQESGGLLITFFFALVIIFLSLAALFESFRDPFIVLISVPMSICGAMIFISLGVGGATLNIYTEVGLVTLIGLISKHGILIVEFANNLQHAGKSKMEAIEQAAAVRFRPILMTTAAMVLGVVPLIFASGAGAVSRFSIGLVIATGISIGTLFTLFVVPAMYLFLAEDHSVKRA